MRKRTTKHILKSPRITSYNPNYYK